MLNSKSSIALALLIVWFGVLVALAAEPESKQASPTSTTARPAGVEPTKGDNSAGSSEPKGLILWPKRTTKWPTTMRPSNRWPTRRTRTSTTRRANKRPKLACGTFSSASGKYPFLARIHSASEDRHRGGLITHKVVSKAADQLGRHNVSSMQSRESRPGSDCCCLAVLVGDQRMLTTKRCLTISPLKKSVIEFMGSRHQDPVRAIKKSRKKIVRDLIAFNLRDRLELKLGDDNDGGVNAICISHNGVESVLKEPSHFDFNVLESARISEQVPVDLADCPLGVDERVYLCVTNDFHEGSRLEFTEGAPLIANNRAEGPVLLLGLYTRETDKVVKGFDSH